eukprot:156663_1
MACTNMPSSLGTSVYMFHAYPASDQRIHSVRCYRRKYKGYLYELYDDKQRKCACNAYFKHMFDGTQMVLSTESNSASNVWALGTICYGLFEALNYFKGINGKSIEQNPYIIGKICDLMRNIIWYDLRVRFIMSRSKIWKPFLQSFLLSISNSAASNRDEVIDMYYLFEVLVFTSENWKKKHFRFAVKHGLNNVLDRLSKLYWTQNDDKFRRGYCGCLQDDIILETYNQKLPTIPRYIKWFMNSFFSKSFNNKYMMNLFLSITKSLNNQYHVMNCSVIGDSKKLEQQRGYYQQLLIDRVEIENMFWEEYNSKSTLVNRKNLHCAWLKCKYAECTSAANCHFAVKFYICKGCKLVSYCSRRHQKLDWKLVHGSQCKRLQSLDF